MENSFNKFIQEKKIKILILWMNKLVNKNK